MLKHLLAGLRRRLNHRQIVRDTVRATAEGWADQEFIDHVCRQVGPAPIVAVLDAAGYKVAEDGTLLAKPGVCSVCGTYELLHQDVDSPRWLCQACWRSANDGLLSRPSASEMRRVTQRHDECEGCGRLAVLQPGLKSGRWLCSECNLDEMCST